jgi:uncharacterized membrane protein YoaK (UPF0700 family)
MRFFAVISKALSLSLRGAQQRELGFIAERRNAEIDMTEMIARPDDPPVPLAMPVLLSLVAGYLDSYTFLSLFGLFAAQVTGSFVIAGAEFVTSDAGIAGKLIAIAAFLIAAAATAAFCIAARDSRRAILPWMLGLEALLLAIFVAIMLFGPPVRDGRDWHGIIAGVFAAMAMGAQSVLVRLLMKDTPQTNVMTGNMTQLGIALSELIMARARFDRGHRGEAAAREFAHARDRLITVSAITVGFLFGAAAGALAFATTGLRGALVAVVIVGALSLWASVRQRAG